MRIMNLPKLPAQPASASECIRTYLGRLPSGDAPWPHVSMLLTAYLSWPNNEDRRNSFLASCLARNGVPSKKTVVGSEVNVTFEMFGGMNAITTAALDQLSREIGDVQGRWLLVSDIFQSIVDIAFEERAVLRGGASISKAIDLCECEQMLPGHSQLRKAWSEFQDVAHLLAASAYLANEGLRRNTSAEDASILNGIWMAPDAVLALAHGLQEFGLEPKPIQNQRPILNPERLWRLPNKHKPLKPFIIHRRLSETQLAFLDSRRASKQYIRNA